MPACFFIERAAFELTFYERDATCALSVRTLNVMTK